MLGSDRPGYVIQAPFTGSFVQEVQRSSSNWRWPNAAGKARGGAVTRAEMIAGKRFITSGGGADEAAMYGLAGDPGMVRGYAGGGWIVGPSGSDRVLLRGTTGEFIVSPGPARANKEMLEALNAGKLVPNIVTSGPPVGQLVQTSGPYVPQVKTKLKVGGDFSKPSKPVKTPNLKGDVFGTYSPPKKKSSTPSSSSGTVDFSGFIAALAGASGRANSFGSSLGRSKQWTDAFSTSMVNAVRRIDSFSGSGSGSTYQITIENNGVIGSRAEVDKWLAATLERLRRQGKIP